MRHKARLASKSRFPLSTPLVHSPPNLLSRLAPLSEIAMADGKKILITSALPYVNNIPHVRLPLHPRCKTPR
jgi:hypothetical protein